MGLQCPGNTYTFKFIDSLLTFLKSFDVTVEGKAKYHGTRFVSIANKANIKLTFKKNNKTIKSYWEDNSSEECQHKINGDNGKHNEKDNDEISVSKCPVNHDDIVRFIPSLKELKETKLKPISKSMEYTVVDEDGNEVSD